MITGGIDIGSVSTKVVLLKDNEILYHKVVFTGYRSGETGENLLSEALDANGLTREDLHRVYSTGYGRKAMNTVDKAVTEIMCHASGAHFLQPDTAFLIDIGGQDSKAILLDGQGGVKDFVMNDRCAAGTGRFLDVISKALELDLPDFAEASLRSDDPASISSTCTVFAESEVISLISQGESRDDIASGISRSVVLRTLSMARRLGVTPPVMFSGGVALNEGVVHAFEKELDTDILVTPYAQVNGALGAAVLAARD